MAEVKFLVDVNLPYLFSLWHSEEYIHQVDIDPTHDDKLLWQYSKQHGLTIITKDREFGARILYSTPPPKVILIRIGNVRIKVLFESLAYRWDEIINLSRENKLVQVFPNRLEAIC